MTLIRIDFKVSGGAEISRAFDDFGLDVQNMTVPLTRMGDEIVQAIRLQFDTEGVENLGHPWAPLSPVYAAWKLAHFGARPILVRTGDMKRAALDKARALTITPRRLVYEPDSDIIGYHQTGTRFMPARPPVALSNAWRRQAVDRVFSRWINDLRHEAGLPGDHGVV